jgi:hypothetical protein
MEQRVNKLEEKINQLSCDVRELVAVVKMMNDHEKRIRAIEIERAKESTVRNWLSRYWWVIVLLVAGVEPAVLKGIGL